jgi:hypothetical protein
MREPATQTSTRAEASHWLTVRIGEEPIVPREITADGNDGMIVAAARARLAELLARQRHRFISNHLHAHARGFAPQYAYAREGVHDKRN